METPSDRILYYEDENSKLEYQMYDGYIFLHSEISHWNLSVFKNCLRVLNTLFSELRSKQIYTVLAITPNPKFSKLFGGRQINNIRYLNQDYEVILWDLN